MVRLRPAFGEQFNDSDAGLDRDLRVIFRHGPDFIRRPFAAQRLPFDFCDGLFGFGDAALAEQVTHRFRHVSAHKEQQDRRNDPHREQAAPTESRQDR